MAVPSLSNVPVTIDDAESTANWSSATLDSDIKRQGNNSVSDGLRADGSTFAFTYGFAAGLGNQVIRLWCTNNLTPYMESYANEGLSFYTIDSIGNTRYYTIAGFDTYNGGWLNLAISYTSGVFATSGTSTTTSQPVSEIGIRFTRTSQPRVGENIWLDYLRRGAGYTATGGTSSDPITPDTIATVDNSNGYGILLKEDGVLFCSGVVTIGSGATATDFDSIGDLIVYPDNPYMRSPNYGIVAAGSGCNVLFDGTVIKTAGDNAFNRYNFDLSDSNVTATVTGCLLDKGNLFTFSSGQSVTKNTFNVCNQIATNGATFTDNVVKNSSSLSSLVVPIANATALSGNSFTSDGSNHAVEFTGTAQNFTWDNLLDNYDPGTTGSDVAVTTPTFNEAIYVNITTGTVNITVASTATIPSVRSAGATVNVTANQVTLTLTGLVANSEVRIYSAGTTTELAGIENSGTTFQYSYTYAASTFVDIVIHNVGYIYQRLANFELGSSNASIPITQIFDRNYSNP